MTWSNPACNVLVGENSEITAAKSTVPETNKSTANRLKPSISSTSSPSSAGNPAVNGNNGAGDTVSGTTGSTSSIGGNLANTKRSHFLRRRYRRNLVSNVHEFAWPTMFDAQINRHNNGDTNENPNNNNNNLVISENNHKLSNAPPLTPPMAKFNGQSVQNINANGKRDELTETFMQSGNDAEMRIFTPTDRNTVNGQSQFANIVATEDVKRRQRRNVEDDDVKGSTYEGSGSDDVTSTHNYGNDDIENGGNSWVNPHPLTVNIVRYQFDGSDTTDGISDIESQPNRKLDVSNLMLDEIEPDQTTFKVPSKFENVPLATGWDGISHQQNRNDMENIPSDSPVTNEFDESFELITDSFHENSPSTENEAVDDSHQMNDIRTTQMASDMKSDRTDVNWEHLNDLVPQALVAGNGNDQNMVVDAKIDDTFNDNINHKPDDSDSTLQNDSPALIVQYDKQPTLEINHLDTDSSGVVEQVTAASEENVRNANTNANDIFESNTMHSITKPPQKPPQSSENNSIDGNGNIELSSSSSATMTTATATVASEAVVGMKHTEPRYEMLDAAHNESINARDMQQNMQRILVNVSIGTDSGDGTQNHGIYMLHVSVPAGPYLKPAHFDGMPPQTAFHEPAIFIKPQPNQIADDAVAPQTLRQSHEQSFYQEQKQQHYHHPASDYNGSQAGGGGDDGNLRQKSAPLLECNSEISRLNSIIANLNKTMSCTNSAPQHSVSSSSSSSSRNGNESLIATETDGEVTTSTARIDNENQNEYQMTMTTQSSTETTVSDYNANDNRINNNNFCLCNQDIPPILILEGKRFAYSILLRSPALPSPPPPKKTSSPHHGKYILPYHHRYPAIFSLVGSCLTLSLAQILIHQVDL